jgi:hypothetical protein
MTGDPDESDIFRQHAESKACRHGRLLVALGVATGPEPDDQPREDEREQPDEPAASSPRAPRRAASSP